jgi:ADP-heptose:LPS heptosyltransferase
MLRDIFYNYIPGLLSWLYFRHDIRLIHASDKDIELKAVKTVCILANSELTNLAPLTSMLKAFRDAIDDLKLLVIVDSEDTGNCLEKSSLADSIFVLHDTVKINKALRQIRNEWIDLTISVTYPSYANAKIVFQTGALYSIGFRYDYKTHKDTDFFFTHPIPFAPQKPEVERYLELLHPLGLYRLP